VLADTGESQSLRLSVIDTGVGISAEEQQRLFEPFVQAGGSALAAAGGTGLGLVISRRLAELMGGTVHMISSLGHGTSLNLDVQVRTAPADLLPPPMEAQTAELRRVTQGLPAAPGAREAAAEGTLVLVVDDHPVNRMLLQEQLESLGYASETANDGGQALERLQQARFGLVLTDCQMPGMDGYTLARRIRQAEAEAGSARLPIIACTAMALEGEAQKCLDAGMDDVVFKPVELRPLLEKLARWLPIAQRDPALRSVDTAMISSTWGCDAATIRHIVDVYHRTAGEDCAALRDALARRDLDSVREVAHRMLGASRTVGARDLSESSERLRLAAHEGSWEAIATAIAAIEAQYAQLGAELAAAS
jgi:CheY-like chemotaxis protein/HPt (histidine-containing phosphotransfer) domain-containing protein